MKPLIILANPSKTSFSHALAEAYRDAASKYAEEITLLDLYDIDQEFLSYESTTAMKAGNHNGGEKQKMVQKLLSECDHYVFIFPVWWASMPAILKNFFDVNFSAGFAFEFVSGKALPKKLLSGKTAELIYHSDAPAFLYKLPFISGIHIRKHIANSILGFCGVKTTKVLAIGGLRNKSEAEKKKILEKVSG